MRIARLPSADFSLTQAQGDRNDGMFPLEQTGRIAVARIDALARRKGCTPAQPALAWVLARGEDIGPIPGTKRRRYLDENLAAADLALAAGDLAALDEAVPSGAAAGARYPEGGMRAVGR
jgi:aryl-alcohol dehydrogenase-like predicted oxidoreductase